MECCRNKIWDLHTLTCLRVSVYGGCWVTRKAHANDKRSQDAVFFSCLCGGSRWSQRRDDWHFFDPKLLLQRPAKRREDEEALKNISLEVFSSHTVFTLHRRLYFPRIWSSLIYVGFGIKWVWTAQSSCPSLFFRSISRTRCTQNHQSGSGNVTLPTPLITQCKGAAVAQAYLEVHRAVNHLWPFLSPMATPLGCFLNFTALAFDSFFLILL